ncbi:MAG: signal peptidase I [Planctomycetota bacterium]
MAAAGAVPEAAGSLTAAATVAATGVQEGDSDRVGQAAANAPPPKESPAATLLSLLIKSIICAVILWLFVFQISFVKGESMEPSFHEGDRLVIDKLTYLLSNVQRDDVVVFDHERTMFDAEAADGKPEQEIHEDYIKRVIGVPGDLVRIHRGVVYVNGKAQAEPFAQESGGERWDDYPTQSNPADRTVTTDPTGMPAVRVEPGHVFVMGDNRGHSTDSRVFGQVKISDIRGKVRIRMLPLSRFKWFSGGE